MRKLRFILNGFTLHKKYENSTKNVFLQLLNNAIHAEFTNILIIRKPDTTYIMEEIY